MKDGIDWNKYKKRGSVTILMALILPAMDRGSVFQKSILCLSSATFFCQFVCSNTSGFLVIVIPKYLIELWAILNLTESKKCCSVLVVRGINSLFFQFIVNPENALKDSRRFNKGGIDVSGLAIYIKVHHQHIARCVGVDLQQ